MCLEGRNARRLRRKCISFQGTCIVGGNKFVSNFDYQLTFLLQVLKNQGTLANLVDSNVFARTQNLHQLGPLVLGIRCLSTMRNFCTVISLLFPFLGPHLHILKTINDMDLHVFIPDHGCCHFKNQLSDDIFPIFQPVFSTRTSTCYYRLSQILSKSAKLRNDFSS